MTNQRTIQATTTPELTNQLYTVNAEIELLLKQKTMINAMLKEARGRVTEHLEMIGATEIQIGDNIYYLDPSSHNFIPTEKDITAKQAIIDLQYDLSQQNHFRHLINSKIDAAKFWAYYNKTTNRQRKQLDELLDKHCLKPTQRTTLKSKPAPTVD